MRARGTAVASSRRFGKLTPAAPHAPAALVRWWPAVYLDVQEVTPGARDGCDKVINLYTKGWLPYTLRWRFQVTKVDWPYRFELTASGDFVGRGISSLAQDDEWVNVRYDWRIHADKPLLYWLSPLLKPIFSANHHWAMRQGERSLKLELARQQAPDAAARQQLPAPPGPTFGWLLGGGEWGGGGGGGAGTKHSHPPPNHQIPPTGALSGAPAPQTLRRRCAPGGPDRACRSQTHGPAPDTRRAASC